MSKFTLVIGNKNYSSWSLRPWLLMKYSGIPFEEILIPLYRGDFKEKIYKYSAAGKVPTLKHGLLTVWESIAICEYIADIFPRKNLLPRDKKKKAWARSIIAEMHAGFQALRTNCPMDIKAKRSPKANPPELARDVDRIKTIWDECRTINKKGGDFLFGHFTIADAVYAPVVFRFQTYGIQTIGEVKKYCQTMLALPAMKEWQAAAIKEPWTIDSF